jgi:dipeptidyl aminopeptidase/acylaminoacyl peptidase
MTPQAGVVLVATRAEGRDATVIRNFDLTTFAFGEVVAEQAGHDMDGALVDQNHQLVASAFYDERQDYAFADPSFAAHFRGVNSYFHNQCNVEVFDVDASHSRFVFKVTGPRDPGSYHLYHRDGSRLEAIGDRLPKLSPDRLAPSEVHKIKVRDGAEITAYLTVPMGADPGRPLPMVVFPHGGPELRDKLEFDPFTQAMAARGWLVLQPNFRGSSGYGKSFADQGRRHWGDRMQEDVEDCVSLLVARGRADPQRLAICGASYGGYAALMGAVRQPRRYKAIVSIAGPSDLVTFLADARHDDGVDSPAYAYWTATIGDLKADLAMLTTASPARRAAEVQAPVLLIHGTRDNVVDPEQSKIMAKALKDAGKPCQYVELPGASHNGWTLKTTRTVIGSAVDFIAQHL